jgi:hypothetical protein
LSDLSTHLRGSSNPWQGATDILNVQLAIALLEILEVALKFEKKKLL